MEKNLNRLDANNGKVQKQKSRYFSFAPFKFRFRKIKAPKKIAPFSQVQFVHRPSLKIARTELSALIAEQFRTQCVRV
jgi:hypothetical protein